MAVVSHGISPSRSVIATLGTLVPDASKFCEERLKAPDDNYPAERSHVVPIYVKRKGATPLVRAAPPRPAAPMRPHLAQCSIPVANRII